VEAWSPDTLSSSGESVIKDSVATHPPIVVRVAPRHPSAGTAAIRVGRSWSQSDVVLPFSTLSKRHALIRHAGGDEWSLEDVGSRNGTFLAGERLPPGQPVALRDGAKLKFGNVVARFSLAASFRDELRRRSAK
jgi:pSer/pThr/pTyr-binding forkhead associated (FHA) protein